MYSSSLHIRWSLGYMHHIIVIASRFLRASSPTCLYIPLFPQGCLIIFLLKLWYFLFLFLTHRTSQLLSILLTLLSLHSHPCFSSICSENEPCAPCFWTCSFWIKILLYNNPICLSNKITFRSQLQCILPWEDLLLLLI